jgi:APA family basic amino acid/polyamine antiporter
MTTDGSSRQLGLWMTSAIVVGSMIGSGIFLLPVSLAPLGINSVAGWIVSGLGALAIAYSISKISRRGAGIQASIEEVVGPTVGYLVTFAFWCSAWVSVGALGIATATAVSWLDPRLQTNEFTIAVALLSILIHALVNSRGVRASGGVSLVTVAIRLVPLLAVLTVAVSRGINGQASGHLAPVPLSAAGLAGAVALTLFALTGFENATAPVEKVRDPARVLPRALLGGVTLVALLYLISSTAILLVLPQQQLVTSAAPFADAVALQWDRPAAVVAAAGIAVAAFGSLNANLLAGGELAYSMALRGDMPPFFARTKRARTPVAAHWLTAGLAMSIVLANASKTTAGLFSFLVLLTTASTLVLYLVGSLVAWARGNGTERAAILLAIGFCLFAFWGAGFEADAWLLALLAVAYLLRLAMHRLSSRAGSIPAVEASPAAPPV